MDSEDFDNNKYCHYYDGDYDISDILPEEHHEILIENYQLTDQIVAMSHRLQEHCQNEMLPIFNELYTTAILLNLFIN